MIEQVELSSFDLRYKSHRLKHTATEKKLLSSILEHGIREPLQGVDTVETPELPGIRILLNGFKRYRCAVKLSHETLASYPETLEFQHLREFNRRREYISLDIPVACAFLSFL
jgi:hypothetical protein